MIFSYEQIKNVTFGTIKTEQTENGICFDRMTERQLELFSSLHQLMGRDALSTAGIRLDFVTDGTDLEFTVGNEGKYEVLVDGVIKTRIIAKDGETVSVNIGDSYDNKTDKKRVTLVLPSHSRGILKSVEVKNCSFIEKHKFDEKILFLGDSITQGWNTFFNTTSYVWRLALLANADFVNQGIGRTYYLADGLDEIPFDPDKIFISYGTNDYARPEMNFEVFEKNVSEYYNKIDEMYNGKEIYVISPIWRKNHDYCGYGNLEDLTAIIKRLCEKHNYNYVDGLTLVPPQAEMYVEDMLHPNDLGMASYAENLFKIMMKE